jgi:hypothetical protein
MKSKNWPKLRNFAIEMLLYSLFVTIYLFLVVRYLSGWLLSLYENNLTVYAIVALGFIVAQGVLLDAITSFVMDRLGLDRTH